MTLLTHPSAFRCSRPMKPSARSAASRPFACRVPLQTTLSWGLTQGASLSWSTRLLSARLSRCTRKRLGALAAGASCLVSMSLVIQRAEPSWYALFARACLYCNKLLHCNLQGIMQGAIVYSKVGPCQVTFSMVGYLPSSQCAGGCDRGAEIVYVLSRDRRIVLGKRCFSIYPTQNYAHCILMWNILI